MTRIILFGGSFDPIHNGHLKMAKAAIKQRGADALWFIPTKRSPFKDSSSNFEDRVRMIEMMIYGFDKMSVDRIEETLPEPSYSIDTVKELKRQYPDTSFEWLIGSDQLERMNEWKDIETLKSLVTFIVYGRSEHVVTELDCVEGDLFPISSTEIRNGSSTQTHPNVLRYMMHEGLYLDSMITYRLSQKRADHVRRVTDLACELAKIHHVDVKKTRLAAMMHDYCKEDDKESMKALMDTVYPRISLQHPALYHGYAAKEVLSRKYYIKDKHVLKAVSGHVEGSAHNPIAMIVYIADKCEPQRTWNFKPFLELSKKDLTQGFKAIKHDVEAWRKL